MVYMPKSSKEKGLLRRVYKLGFEVGYHKHFEMGAISEKYSLLLDKTSEFDLEEEAKKYYKKGKIDGEKKREKDLAEGLSKRGLSKEKTKKRKSFDYKRYAKSDINKDERSKDLNFSHSVECAPTKEPDITSAPSSLNRTEAISLPSFLELFHKPSKKEK